MKKNTVPLRCQRCALAESCDYLKPLNCPHFREQSTTEAPSQDEILRVTLHKRSQRFVLFGEIIAGVLFGVGTYAIPLLLLVLVAALLSPKTDLSQNNIVAIAVIIPLYILGCVVSGFRAGIYSTQAQQWRHAAILAIIGFWPLFSEVSAKRIFISIFAGACVFLGAYLTKYTDKIPFVNKLTVPYQK